MGLLETYDYIFTDIADRRTNHWFLVGSPVPLLLLTFAYLYFVLRCGPRYMSDKQPYVLLTYTKCYNLFQVLGNCHIVQQIIAAGFFTDIGLGCTPFKYTYEPCDYQMAHISWWIMCMKILDYSETVIFVLRKKNRQISFLHLYHHVTTAWLAWLVVKYYAGGMAMMMTMSNSIVHVIMYTYYFLTCFGENVQRYTNLVKPYITIVQMVQFWIMMIYTIQIFTPGCAHNGKLLGCVFMVNLMVNFLLFYRFYRKSYPPKRKE